MIIDNEILNALTKLKIMDVGNGSEANYYYNRETGIARTPLVFDREELQLSVMIDPQSPQFMVVYGKDTFSDNDALCILVGNYQCPTDVELYYALSDLEPIKIDSDGEDRLMARLAYGVDHNELMNALKSFVSEIDYNKLNCPVIGWDVNPFSIGL